MSELQAEEFTNEDFQEEIIENVVIEEAINDEEPQDIETAEDIARKGGWKPKEEWVAAGRDPSEWRSAEIFNNNGEWIEKFKQHQSQIDSIIERRMESVNKLHQAQLEMQKKELQRKRDEAIDIADREAANSYQREIDELNQYQPTAESPTTDNAQEFLDQWNQQNPWIMQNTPKSAYAKAQYSLYSQQYDAQTAVKMVEADVAREFPAVNPNRSTHPTSEGGSKAGAKRPQRKLSMADLTHEERSIYKNMPGTWASEAEFLKAVQDSRSA